MEIYPMTTSNKNNVPDNQLPHLLFEFESERARLGVLEAIIDYGQGEDDFDVDFILEESKVIDKDGSYDIRTACDLLKQRKRQQENRAEFFEVWQKEIRSNYRRDKDGRAIKEERA